MVKKCIVPNCRLDRNMKGFKILGIREFPKKEKYRKLWIRALKENFHDQIDDLLKNKNRYVCDLHFDDCYFYKNGQGKRLLLQKGSSPSVFTNFRDNALKALIDKYQRILNCVPYKNIPGKVEPKTDPDLLLITSGYDIHNIDESSMSVDSIKIENFNDNKNFNNVDEKKSSRNRMSFGQYDLTSIDYTDIPGLKKLMKKAQNEISTQQHKMILYRRMIRSLRMRIRRHNAKIKNMEAKESTSSQKLQNKAAKDYDENYFFVVCEDQMDEVQEKIEEKEEADYEEVVYKEEADYEEVVYKEEADYEEVVYKEEADYEERAVYKEEPNYEEEQYESFDDEEEENKNSIKK